MKVVIMEDHSKQLLAAIAAAEAAGHTVVATKETYYGSLAETFGRCSYDGILTDLTVPNLEYPKFWDDLGYRVVEEALRVGKPVVVCSGMRESYPDDLEPLVAANRHLIDWVDRYTPDQEYKRWDDAVAALERLVIGPTRD